MELMQVKNQVVFYATLSQEAAMSPPIPEMEHLGSFDSEQPNDRANPLICSEG